MLFGRRLDDGGGTKAKSASLFGAAPATASGSSGPTFGFGSPPTKANSKSGFGAGPKNGSSPFFAAQMDRAAAAKKPSPFIKAAGPVEAAEDGDAEAANAVAIGAAVTIIETDHPQKGGPRPLVWAEVGRHPLGVIG